MLIKTKLPLALGVCLFCIATLSAQPRYRPRVTPVRSFQSLAEVKVKKRISYGPHYKNPRAAGRNLVLNRARPAKLYVRKKRAVPKRKQLYGPAYKNRKITPSTRFNGRNNLPLLPPRE